MALKHLGHVSNKPTLFLDLVPWENGDICIDLLCSEFTSFCPVTSQPDFGTILIKYTPKRHIVETKSLKLFIWSFREAKAYNETLVAKIAETFYTQVNPLWVRVEGKFNPRGGISVNPVAYRGKK